MNLEDRNYYADPRVQARDRRSPFLSVDENKMKAVIEVYDEDTDESTELEVPIVMEVCSTCDGRGKHVNPSIDSGGISADDFAEDPDFAEEYRRGAYDVTCYECAGKRVVPVLDEDRLPPEIRKNLREKAEADESYRRECEAERRMGA